MKKVIKLAVACVVLLLAHVRPAAADPLADVRAFAGAPLRMVWIQDAGPTACVYSEKPTIRLMGLDTEDGKGERPILPEIGWYGKPQLTADGNRVVFHDLAKHTVNIVNFDGSGRREVVAGAGAFEDDAVWTDPKTDTSWIYCQIIEHRAGAEVPTIRRYQLENPKINELIWDKIPVFMFMLSGDNRLASGGIGNGGATSQGVYVLPNRDYQQHAAGCWPSIAPDASHYSWVFTGNHRSITFYKPFGRDGTVVQSGIDFNAPGLMLNGQDEMYHPRWTNNVRYLACDAPFSHWAWQTDAKIPPEVSAKVEIYLGKFNQDFTAIEQWVQVTHNDRGDYWPNVWIKPSQAEKAAATAATDLPEQTVPAAQDTHGLVYTWLSGADANQIKDPEKGTLRQCTGQLHGAARFGLHSVLDLEGGSFVPDDAAALLLKAVKASREFSLEAVITPQGPRPEKEAIVMGFAEQATGGNFLLTEQNGQLLFHLKTGAAGHPSPPPISLGSVTQGRGKHVVVSYAGNHLSCFLDGRTVTIPATDDPAGGLTGWTVENLVFGDSAKGGANWAGSMENVSLFSRGVSAAEARERFRRYREKAGRRQPVETVVMDAKLIGRCPAADPKGIAPYRRCLSVQLYEVGKVISGKCADAKISVAQWSVLDGQVVTAYSQMAVGQTQRIAVQKMDDHPEQEGERSITGEFDANNTALYYEVRMPAAATIPPAGLAANELTDANPASLISNGAVALSGHGSVAAVSVVNAGYGYTDPPAVHFIGGGGSGAAGEVSMALGSVDLTGVGAGFISEPAVTVSAPDLAEGRVAKVKANIDRAGGTISTLDILDPGTGYLQTPQVTIAGGGGSGAQVEAFLQVSAVAVTNGGHGYTLPPQVSFDGGSGHDATAQGSLVQQTVRYTNGSKAAYTTAGTLTQDGAVMVFDWAMPKPANDPFTITNSGIWTLRHSSRVQVISSVAAPEWIGYKISVINTGQMTLAEHSRVDSNQLENTGTLELGEGAALNQPAYPSREGTLRNLGQGTIKITGASHEQPATFGVNIKENYAKRFVENGSADGKSTAALTVGTGQDAAAFAVVGGQVNVTNFPGSSLELRSGALLALLAHHNGADRGWNNNDARIVNQGALLWNGQLRVQGNHTGFTGIDNEGVLTIRDPQAVLERLQNSGGPGGFYKEEYSASQIRNEAGGVIRGSGCLTYVNQTGENEGRYAQLTNWGVLAPGDDGAGGKGHSAGRLVFREMNLGFGTVRVGEGQAVQAHAGTLRINILGPAEQPSSFDAIVLEGKNDDGKLELLASMDNVLNVVVPANINRPRGTYRIVTAANVAGTFKTLQYNGTPAVPYTVSYLPNAIEVKFP